MPKTIKEWEREYIDSVTVREVYKVEGWEPEAMPAKVSQELREYHEGSHDRVNHNDQDDRVDIPPQVPPI